MRRIVIALGLLLLCSVAWGSFHAVGAASTGNNTALTSVALPTVSNGDYVLCSIGVFHSPTSQNPPYNAISGWTTLYDNGGMALYGQVWLTGAATTISFSAPQNGANGLERAVCWGYTGVDNTTPIDGAINAFVINYASNQGSTSANPNICEAPSVSPAYTNDMLVGVFLDNAGGSESVSFPGALTSRVSAGGATQFNIGDTVLGSGAATGDIRISYTGNDGHFNHTCAQILLKAASGGSSATTAVAPTGGCFLGATGGGIGIDFSACYPINGDLILGASFGAGGGSNCTAVSGWTYIYASGDVCLIYKSWHTGDAVSAGSGFPNLIKSIFVVRNYNPSGATIVTPTVDPVSPTGGVNSASSSTTLASTSLSLSGTSDLYLVFYSAGNVGTANNGAWTIAAGLNSIMAYKLSSIYTMSLGLLVNPSNPTGTVTGTDSASGNLWAGSSAFCIVCGGSGLSAVPRHRSQVY